MAYYPFSPENDAHYKLALGSNVATFNNPSDPDFVGMIEEITGLDGAEIRESAEDLVQADGGVHGDFYYGRRPIVISGRSYGHSTVAQRNARLDKLRRACNALRADATLSWKPSTRLENLIKYGTFENDLTGWTAATAAGGVSTATAAVLSSTWAHAGAKSVYVTATHDASTSNASYVFDGRTANSNAGRFPVTPGKTYTGSYYLNLTDAPVTGVARARIYWYKADGTASAITPNVTGSGTSITAGGIVRPSVSAVAPSDAAFAALFLEPYVSWATASDTIAFYVDSAMVNEGPSALAYMDGDTAGRYWQSAPHASASGDFIEMFTTVRAQQPPRNSGGWVKNFQAALVSEYAQLFGATQIVTAALPGSVGGGTTHIIENRGSGKAMPIIRINGDGGASPYVENMTTGEIVRTNISLGAGQWLDIDTLNHTATRETGAAANGSINYLTSSVIWPSLQMGNNTLRVVNAGSMVLTYRDTWV